MYISNEKKTVFLSALPLQNRKSINVIFIPWYLIKGSKISLSTLGDFSRHRYRDPHNYTVTRNSVAEFCLLLTSWRKVWKSIFFLAAGLTPPGCSFSLFDMQNKSLPFVTRMVLSFLFLRSVIFCHKLMVSKWQDLRGRWFINYLDDTHLRS